MHRLSGRLTARAPFDFGQTLAFARRLSAETAPSAEGSQALVRALHIESTAVVVDVRSSGSIDGPRLEYRLHSDRPIGAEVHQAAEKRIADWLSLHDDLLPFYALAADDPPFMPVVDTLYGYHQLKFTSLFEAACWAIVSRRNHPPGARRMQRGLVDAFGQRLVVEGTEHAAFPEPKAVAGALPETLAAIIGHRRKAAAIGNTARALLTADEHFLRHADYADADAWLQRISGIGPWSSAFVLLRALGRTDHIPPPDRGLLRQVEMRYGPGRDPYTLAAHYGDYQGYWVHYLRAASG
jgi:DNA-3-methyladenine glycosylase II